MRSIATIAKIHIYTDSSLMFLIKFRIKKKKNQNKGLKFSFTQSIPVLIDNRLNYYKTIKYIK